MADGEPKADQKEASSSNGGQPEGAAAAGVGEKKGEQTSLVPFEESESPKNLANLYKAALAISWISIFFSLASGIAAIVLSFQKRSESLFAYGLDATLDSLSSVAVVWRFSECVDHVKARTREYKACLVIGCLFLVSATSLIVRSIHSLVHKTRESKELSLFITFSLICGLSSLVIGITKIYIGIKVGSQALYTDSIITLVGAVTCFMALAGIELYIENKELWFFDSVFGIVCGVFLIFFGVRLLFDTLQNRPKS